MPLSCGFKAVGTGYQKKSPQDQPSLPKADTVAIEQLIKKTLKQVDLKSRRSGNGSGSAGGSSVRSDIT